MNPGLRERKKQATRRALSQAAMDLALERGVEGVTAEAIAEAADVSTRTFHNYFATKEAAIIAVIADRVQDLVDELRSRPAAENIWDSLREVLIDSVARDPKARDSFFGQLTLIHNNIGLLHEHLGAIDDMRMQFAAVVADRTGSDADRDLYPHLQAAAAAQCVKVATDVWWQQGRDSDLAALINDAFRQLQAGLPPPEQASSSQTPQITNP